MAHDYDPSWDYDVVRRPSSKVKAFVEAAKRAHLKLWKRLGFEEPPKFVYVRGLQGHLARFIDGTETAPIFVLDAEAIERTAKKHNVDLKTAVWSTLLHEYGHAYVRSIGLELDPEDEEEAVEQFAQTSWEDDWETGYALSQLNERLGL